MAPVAALTRSFTAAYAEAFAGFLAAPDEHGRRRAYELGREAVARELTVLDLAQAHHESLGTALRELPDQGELVAVRAGEFFLDAVSAFEMAQRVYRDGREQALAERRNAAQLRQLTTFLADASLAFGASDSLAEMLQLVAEQTRELLDAGFCRLVVTEGVVALEAVSTDDGQPSAPAVAWAELTALDGRLLGRIEVGDTPGGTLTPLDEALLAQLAHLAAAAVERSALYRR